MTIASKTVLVQMRFTRAGSVFCDVGAKSSIDTSGISVFINRGSTFFGVSDEITPPTYSSLVFPTRNGMPYLEVTAKNSIDASFGQGKSRQGLPFVVRFAGTSVYPLIIAFATRFGAPFRDVVAKESIDASEHDYFRLGAPFWVKYGGAPPPFNTTRFFLLF